MRTKGLAVSCSQVRVHQRDGFENFGGGAAKATAHMPGRVMRWNRGALTGQKTVSQPATIRVSLNLRSYLLAALGRARCLGKTAPEPARQPTSWPRQAVQKPSAGCAFLAMLAGGGAGDDDACASIIFP